MTSAAYVEQQRTGSGQGRLFSPPTTALMRAIAPTSFVEFKRWMAAKAPRRPEAKRRRDLRQAETVQKLLDEGLLMAPPEVTW